ncbi:MAG: glycosyltransferase family 39 protein [Solirubrobacteraceae bacterium]
MSTIAELSGQPPATARSLGRVESVAVRHRYALAVAALTLFALALRFSQIRQGLFGDEVWTYQDILGCSLGEVLTTVHTGGENSPPLFFVLAYATGKLGDPSVWIRLPSIVLGALTIPLVYLIGRETVGRAQGVLAAALLAFSPFSLFYGVEARPYATMAFFVALSTWALLRAVDGSGSRWWVLYVVGAVAAAYTHYTSIFVLVTQGLRSMWACRDRIRAPLISAAAVVAAYLPWLPELRGKQLAVIGALHPLSLHNSSPT